MNYFSLIMYVGIVSRGQLIINHCQKRWFNASLWWNIN